MLAVQNALGRATTGPPVACQNLTMFPLVARDDVAPSTHVAFGEARRRGTVEITETSEDGSVPELRVVNADSACVLLLDGEELVGAKQNRVVNLTILVPAHATLAIPVTCVEAGRWSSRSRAFEDAGRTMYAGGRRAKLQQVSDALRRDGSRRAEQASVWSDIDERSRRLGVASPTNAMSDLFERHHARLESYTAGFAPVAGQVGALFAIDGRVVGMDLFDAPAMLASYLPAIVRGYALDALESEPVARDVDRAVVARALDALLAAAGQRHPAVGVGEDLRLRGSRVEGAALVADDALVHLTAFWTGDDEPAPGAHRSRAIVQRLSATRSTDVRPGAWLDREPPPLPNDPSTWDRAEGMLLGLAIGDALGNTTESMSPAERQRRHGEIRDYLPNAHAGGRRVGLPSDDSQLAFWTLEHLLECDGLDAERLARTLASRRIYGIGSTMRAFLRAFQEQGLPWAQAAQRSAGNGALMRIAPVLVPHLRQPSAALWSDTAVAALLTHNDPASLGACVGFVRALWGALAARRPPGAGWWLTTICDAMREIEGDATRYVSRTPQLPYDGPMWRFVETQVRVALAHDLPVRVACDRWRSGAYLMETLPSVIYILERHAGEPAEAIVRAVNDTWDNDTIAAVVGAATGALHGARALPRSWVQGLAGRTMANDDGRVFALIEAARARWAPR